VADSSIHGRGLFARRGIPKGTWIGRYDGRQTNDDGMYVLWIEAGEGAAQEWIGIDGTNELRFLNHADDPSGEMDGQDLYARRDILEGEEITIHYGEEWEQA
jgi:hypothetical protein